MVDITVGKLLTYPMGVLLILLGVVSLFTSPVSGGVFIITGVLLLPVIRTKLSDQGVSLSRGVVAVIFIVGVAAGGGLLVGNTPGVSEGTPTAADSGAESTQQQESLTHEVQESFVVGEGDQSLEYTVQSVSYRDSVGSSAVGQDANGQFLVIELSIENVGSETVDILTSYFTVVDGQEREYEADSEAMAYVDSSISFEQVTPGTSLEGTIVFDVPADNADRELVIEPAGAFSGADEHQVPMPSRSG